MKKLVVSVLLALTVTNVNATAGIFKEAVDCTYADYAPIVKSDAEESACLVDVTNDMFRVVDGHIKARRHYKENMLERGEARALKDLTYFKNASKVLFSEIDEQLENNGACEAKRVIDEKGKRLFHYSLFENPVPFKVAKCFGK